MANTGVASAVPASIARDFIDQQGASFHEAFGVDSHFNTTTSRYQSKEVSDLEEALKEFKSSSSLQADFDFDLLRCTWDDVLHELERARAAANESEARNRKRHRKAWEWIGTTGNDFIMPALGAFPDELCALHGGLAVMFSLARMRAQSRQKILGAFEDIPNVITMAMGKAETLPRDHPWSEQLHRMVRDLQQTLLRTLPALIDRLNPGTIVDKLMSPFKGIHVDDLLEAVRISSDRVRACAEGIMDSVIVDTHHTIHNNFKTTQNIHTITQQTGGEVGELRGKIEEILKQQKDFQLTLDSISGKNSLLSFLMEYLKQEPAQPAVESHPPEQSRPDYEPTMAVTPRQLLRLMNVHHLEALDIEHHIIRRGHSMDGDAVSQAASMFQTSQVQQLMHSANSGVVLVNGCTDRSQHAKISPLTYVCANLAHALRRSADRHIVLAFFCGQHTTSKDDLKGPQGLMRSLVAFLILTMVQNAYISDSAPVFFSELPEDFDNISFKDICQLFYHLVELVPNGVTVYCIVDGISYYEQAVFKEEYELMMDCFGSIIMNNATPGIFKLLLTSPTISRWLPSLQPHQRVSLRNTRRKSISNPEAYLQATFANAVSQQD